MEYRYTVFMLEEVEYFHWEPEKDNLPLMVGVDSKGMYTCYDVEDYLLAIF